MNCSDVEILLTDYVDGGLDTRDRVYEKLALETHLEQCAACAAMARDAAATIAFLERVANVDTPPELINRILFEVNSGASRQVTKPSLWRRWFGQWLEPVFKPRFAMGMAMTVLSFGMMLRFTNVRQLTPADLDPVKVWVSAEDHVTRWWDRGVKYYQNLRVVFDIQSRLNEWAEVQDAAKPDQTQPQSGKDAK